VIVSKVESDTVQTVASGASAPPPVKFYNLVEDIYQDVETTPLEFDVAKGKRETIVSRS